jgi:hypothetical protein
MSRAAYRYTLYRTKRWWPHDTEPVLAGQHGWFDLQDEDATLQQLTEMVTSNCGATADLRQYMVEMTDPVTGETIALSVGDLAAARASRVRQPPQDDGSLSQVSDEALVRELLRRLTRR